MPIYEYRCASCAFQSEYLQKVSDPIRSVCPQCGKATFNKLLTAAGFQLKGSGWYATDFKGSGAKPAEKKPDGDAKPAGEGKEVAKDTAGKSAGGETNSAGTASGTTSTAAGSPPPAQPPSQASS